MIQTAITATVVVIILVASLFISTRGAETLMVLALCFALLDIADALRSGNSA